MNVRESLIANAQSTKPMKPSDRAFDHPTGCAQSRPVLGVASSNFRFDLSGMQPRSMRVRVVAAVSLDTPGAADGVTRLAGDCRNQINQREQLGDVVAIRTGENQRERDALRVDRQVVL